MIFEHNHWATETQHSFQNIGLGHSERDKSLKACACDFMCIITTIVKALGLQAE